MARKVIVAMVLTGLILAGCQPCKSTAGEPPRKESSPAAGIAGWQSLFDGKTLDGWKASENKGTFTVRDGMIVVHGNRSHLFYVGPVADANFTNFEFKADVMTEPGSNSGMYIHTAYQETDWPKKGYEIQVNNTHSDWKKTGSIYDVENVRQPPSKDNEWFTQHIIVQGKRVIVKVNGITVVDWTEPENFLSEGWPGRRVSSGTVAFQGHDPKSIVYYKNIMVRVLPPGTPKKIKAVVVTGGHDFEAKPFFSLFEGYDDIEYTKFDLKDGSEIFEDITNWNYDVIVLFNMTQNISSKRQENFIKLLNRGVGVVALHHAIGSFQDWPQYPKIIGSKYYLKETTEGGVTRPAATYKHDVDFTVHIENAKHPITRNLDDFKAHDEIYKNCGFQKDNQVLLTTDNPDSDKTIGWVRQFGKAKVCTIQVGHGPSVYADPTYRLLIARAIRWSAGRLE